MFRRAVVIAITEKLAPGFNYERASFACTDRLRVRFHYIDRQRVELIVFVFSVKNRADGMSVVVDGFDFGDLRGKLRVNCELGAGQAGERDKQGYEFHWTPKCQPG